MKPTLLASPQGAGPCLFPSSRDPERSIDRFAAIAIWKAVVAKAGLQPSRRLGWHAFRRAFANSLRDVPLRELKDLGGWKTEKTVVSVYLQPDENAQRRAREQLESR